MSHLELSVYLISARGAASKDAVDGMRIVMSIHGMWLMNVITTFTTQANKGIPRDWEAAIGSHKESIIWKTINQDQHNHVCDLIGCRSTVYGRRCGRLTIVYTMDLHPQVGSQGITIMVSVELDFSPENIQANADEYRESWRNWEALYCN